MKWAIDVSHYDATTGRFLPNGKPEYVPIDWKLAGLDLAIIKSSEGTVADPAFAMQWKAAGNAGIPRMAYHFFRCNINPEAQALAAWSIIEREGFTKSDYVILDLETYDNIAKEQILSLTKRWLTEMSRNMTFHSPMIYTYPAYWTDIGGQTNVGAWAQDYPLGIAQWVLDKWVLGFPINVFDPPKMAELKRKVEEGSLKPMALKPWGNKYALWQFTARCRRDCISGYYGNKKVVDYNAVADGFLLTQPTTMICPTCNGLGEIPI